MEGYILIRKPMIILLAMLTMIGPLSIDTYLPSFHAIGTEFQVSPLMVQQTLSVYLFAFSFMMLFYGTLSDSFGRRPVILWSLLVYALASFGAALAPSFGWLLACRVLQGFAAGGGGIVSRAIVRDRTSASESQKVLAYMSMVFGIAPVVAPVLGGWLHVLLGWRSVFVLLGLFGIVIFIISWLTLPESLPPQSRIPFRPGPVTENYWKVIRHTRFQLLSGATSVVSIGFALYISSAAQFVMTILHLPATSFGWLFIPLISGSIFGSWMAARFSARYAPSQMIRAGYIIMTAGVIWNVGYNLLYQASIPWAMGPLMLYAIGLSVVSPALTVMILDIFPDNRGLAASLQGFTQEIVFAVISGVVAPLIFDSAVKLAWCVVAGFVLSFILLHISRSHVRTASISEDDLG